MKATPETPLDDLRKHGIVPPFDVVLHDGAWYVTARVSCADDTPRTILRFVDEMQPRGNALDVKTAETPKPDPTSEVAEPTPLTTSEVGQLDARAVSVRFIGWLPRGRRVVDVDLHKVTEQLLRVFGVHEHHPAHGRGPGASVRSAEVGIRPGVRPGSVVVSDWDWQVTCYYADDVNPPRRPGALAVQTVPQGRFE